jgi:hypothetical protein
MKRFTNAGNYTDPLVQGKLRVGLLLVAGLLARSQYPEGPATGHLGTGLSWFRCV